MGASGVAKALIGDRAGVGVRRQGLRESQVLVTRLTNAFSKKAENHAHAV